MNVSRFGTFIAASLVVIEHVNYVEVSNKVIRVLTQVTRQRLELFLHEKLRK